MTKLAIKSVLEYDEHDTEQGIRRIYLYYTHLSSHFFTDKQQVDILETPHWGKMLFLDEVLQSTTVDEVIYHNALVHPLLLSVPKKSRVLILGGGEGATARELLRWPVQDVIMVDYDGEFVEYMKRYGTVWSKGAFNDPRLQVVYEDAWKFVKYGFKFDAVIIDLTDPDLKADCWIYLLREVLKSVRESKGGFTMNAGLYMPWDTKKLHEIVTMIREICHMNPDFKYYIYTAFIPSFNGEWTFITVLHKSTFMMEPEFMDILPLQIRRSFRTLPDSLIYSDTFPLVPVLNPLN